MSDTELIAHALPQPDRLSLYLLCPLLQFRGTVKEIWVHFLEGRQPKDSQARDQLGEGKTYYLQQREEQWGIFPKVVSSQTAKLGKF